LVSAEHLLGRLQLAGTRGEVLACLVPEGLRIDQLDIQLREHLAEFRRQGVRVEESRAFDGRLRHQFALAVDLRFDASCPLARSALSGSLSFTLANKPCASSSTFSGVAPAERLAEVVLHLDLEHLQMDTREQGGQFVGEHVGLVMREPTGRRSAGHGRARWRSAAVSRCLRGRGPCCRPPG